MVAPAVAAAVKSQPENSVFANDVSTRCFHHLLIGQKDGNSAKANNIKSIGVFSFECYVQTQSLEDRMQPVAISCVFVCIKESQRARLRPIKRETDTEGTRRRGGETFACRKFP